MTRQAVVPDTFTLVGDDLSRVNQALEVARHQIRVAQGALDRGHIEAALAEAEDAIGRQLSRIAQACEDDRVDAEELGDVERERRAWHPRYQAA